MAVNDIEIRPVQPEDAERLFQIVSHPRVDAGILGLPSMEFRQTEEWIKNSSPEHARLVAIIDGKVVGSATMGKHTRIRRSHTGGIGLMVDPDYWGEGVGSALTQALVSLADNWFNLTRLELGVFTDNDAAIRIYEKFGFQIEGTLQRMAYGPGGWRDGHYMARLHPSIVDEPVRNSPMPKLEGREPASVTIRPPRKSDARDLYDLFRHPDVCRTTAQIPSQELALTEERLREENPHLYRYVAEDNGRVVAMASLNRSKRDRQIHSASLGMSVHPDYWGRRVGSNLMEALLDLADNWLNLRRIELDVNTDNLAGIHLYEQCGFEIEGTHRCHMFGEGQWIDSYFMSRLR